MSILQELMKAVPAIGAWARRSWCHGQRRQLVGLASRVLWVAPDKVPWALWGAEQGLYDAEWAGSLLYLRGR
jgi:hypothetical protein